MRLRFLSLSLVFLTASTAHPWSQAIPRSLQGSWRITQVLPTPVAGCWSGEKATKLLNTQLTYAGDTLRWKGGSVRITETLPRTLTAEEFQSEATHGKNSLAFVDLGIRAPHIMEYDLQHDDVDVTDVTTEAPGDSVFFLNPRRIVFTICGTYFEATRAIAK